MSWLGTEAPRKKCNKGSSKPVIPPGQVRYYDSHCTLQALSTQGLAGSPTDRACGHPEAFHRRAAGRRARGTPGQALTGPRSGRREEGPRAPAPRRPSPTAAAPRLAVPRGAPHTRPRRRPPLTRAARGGPAGPPPSAGHRTAGGGGGGEGGGPAPRGRAEPSARSLPRRAPLTCREPATPQRPAGKRLPAPLPPLVVRHFRPVRAPRVWRRGPRRMRAVAGGDGTGRNGAWGGRWPAAAVGCPPLVPALPGLALRRLHHLSPPPALLPAPAPAGSAGGVWAAGAGGPPAPGTGRPGAPARPRGALLGAEEAGGGGLQHASSTPPQLAAPPELPWRGRCWSGQPGLGPRVTESQPEKSPQLLGAGWSAQPCFCAWLLLCYRLSGTELGKQKGKFLHHTLACFLSSAHV